MTGTEAWKEREAEGWTWAAPPAAGAGAALDGDGGQHVAAAGRMEEETGRETDGESCRYSVCRCCWCRHTAGREVGREVGRGRGSASAPMPLMADGRLRCGMSCGIDRG